MGTKSEHREAPASYMLLSLLMRMVLVWVFSCEERIKCLGKPYLTWDLKDSVVGSESV